MPPPSAKVNSTWHVLPRDIIAVDGVRNPAKRILSVGWASVAIGARARPMVRVTASLIGGIGTSVKDNYRGV